MPRRIRHAFPTAPQLVELALLAAPALLLSALLIAADTRQGRQSQRPDRASLAVAFSPTLLGSEVLASGDIIGLTFDRELYPDTEMLPPVTAFTLLVNQTEGEIGEIALSRMDANQLLLLPKRNIFEGDVVTLSYSDPTAADDYLAIQDLDGHDASSFTEVGVTNNSARTRPLVRRSASPWENRLV